jgi:hypothetical protein
VIDVACVVEPDVHQVLGASILSLSLRSHPGPTAFHLVVIDRPMLDVSRLVGAARRLGLECATLRPRSDNRYFNRWLCLDAFPGLRDAACVALLDWDIIRTSDLPLPAPAAGKVGCRPNPPLLYQRLVTELGAVLPRRLAGADGSLASSVNGGVILGDGPTLARVAGASEAWDARLRGLLPACAEWEREQLVTSIAVGEVGLEPLASEWNVTPTSPVDDAATHLWHYNDGSPAAYRLKRNLARPEVVAACCRELAASWPRSVAVFEALHAEALGRAGASGLFD